MQNVISEFNLINFSHHLRLLYEKASSEKAQHYSECTGSNENYKIIIQKALANNTNNKTKIFKGKNPIRQ